jgi:NAD(P)-dependent dehydrogenase (short-subunit alcohol dehydrogenase family)
VSALAERRYEGAAVLITGAASGFGRLAAERFAAEGARLALGDVSERGLTETADLVRGLGGEVVARVTDVAKPEDAEALVQASVAAYGRLDVALNNAGIGHGSAKLPDIPLDEMRRVIEVDLVGVFLAMKYQLPVMERQGGGVILNVASAAGVTGAPLMSAYAAAKHGVVGLTKSAAGEYARKGVRINAICPSFAGTPMVTGMLAHMHGSAEEASKRLLTSVPMRRIAEPEEIVQAMLWICSPQNSFMTGHSLVLDGGLTAL